MVFVHLIDFDRRLLLRAHFRFDRNTNTQKCFFIKSILFEAAAEIWLLSPTQFSPFPADEKRKHTSRRGFID